MRMSPNWTLPLAFSTKISYAFLSPPVHDHPSYFPSLSFFSNIWRGIRNVISIVQFPPTFAEALWPCGRFSLSQKWVPGIFLGLKGD
jgi:hypothetical protein